MTGKAVCARFFADAQNDREGIQDDREGDQKRNPKVRATLKSHLLLRISGVSTL